MTCPDCGSIRCGTNKLPNVSREHMDVTAQSARALGHPVVALGTLTLWAAISTVNELRRDWRCEDCGATFNNARHDDGR